MISNAQKIGLVLAACGGAASAQPFGVNGAGATLLQALFEAPANTLDFIDVDGDTIVQEQLAPFDASFPFLSSQHLQFTYRVIGSVNGFEEHRDWCIPFAVDADGNAANITLNSSFSDSSVFNSQIFVSAGVTQGVAASANPGATPFRVQTNGSYAITTGTGAGTGVQIDFSALDVPATWAVRIPGTLLPNRVPGAAGYGDNPRTAVNRDGTDAIDPISGNPQDNKLAVLDARTGPSLNIDANNADAFTLFDTPVTLTPVAAPVNYGVGLQQIDMSDLRHGFASGRRINGENLVFVTRDSGSGTRNAFANGIGLDPSFCVGENIGARTVSSANDRLGPNFTPSNKGGSSRNEGTVINHRLGIGHTGAERGESAGWLINGRCDLLAVRADLRGGTVFARPTIANIVDGGPDGYSIVGLGGIVTLGDPRSAPANKGGWGWDPSEIGPNPNPTPAMSNVEAAAYVNNITRSVAAVTSVPNDPNNAFSPGEFLAAQFVLPATSFNVLDITPNPTDPVIPAIANPDRNDVLTQFVLNDPNNVLALPEYAAFNNAIGGLVPARTTGVTYSDGLVGGANYVAIDGSSIGYGAPMADLRNKIAGDFDGDGARTASDVADMIAAWNFRFAAGAWNGGSVSPSVKACPEILGDFTGDGNFDAADIRYWADGLHLVGGNLDRKAGFTAVDAAFGGNFFGTTLANGSYDNGDSRADIAGNLSTRGFNPVGNDGVVDLADIDYVCSNFGTWATLTDAVSIDLSADMNGDLVIDADDVIEIVENILESTVGDINLDGVVDASDLSIAQGNVGVGTVYSQGDVDCDGDVDQDDINILNALLCPADLAAPFGTLNFFDIQAFIALFNAQNASADLAAPFGTFNFFDIQAYVSLFNQGCP